MCDDAYGSHLPVLRKILSARLDIKIILETGMGLNSTPFLVDTGADVTSIEMNSEEWLETTKRVIGNNPRWHAVLILDINKVPDFIKGFGYADFVFIDGNGDNRFDQINASFFITNLIVVHDTEEKGYQWERVVLPQGWEWFNVVDSRPWTGIITTDKKILEMFR